MTKSELIHKLEHAETEKADTADLNKYIRDLKTPRNTRLLIKKAAAVIAAADYENEKNANGIMFKLAMGKVAAIVEALNMFVFQSREDLDVRKIAMSREFAELLTETEPTLNNIQ